MGRKAGNGAQLVDFYHPGNTPLSSASSLRYSPTSFNSVSYQCFCEYFLLFASPELSAAFVDSPSSWPLWYFLGALLLSRSQLRRQRFLVILASSWLLLVASLSLCLLFSRRNNACNSAGPFSPLSFSISNSFKEALIE